MGPQGKEGMSYRFGERTHSRIECARSNSWGLNAETKKCRHRARRRSFSLDILSYRTFPQLRRRVVLLERKRTQKTKKPKAVYTKVLTPPSSASRSRQRQQISLPAARTRNRAAARALLAPGT